ncbi:MAG: TldD/PmbA family protein [Rhodothermia bacterium]|nr:TldD/PmbA family protein [Rhodothermia bacterium]
MTSPYTATSRVCRRDWENLAEKYPAVLSAAVSGGADRAVLFAESRRRIRHRLTQALRNGRPEPPHFRRDEGYLEGASITVDRGAESWLESANEVRAETLLGIAKRVVGPRITNGIRATVPDSAQGVLDTRPLFEEMECLASEEAQESLRIAAEFATSLVPQLQRITVDLIETTGLSFVACADLAGGAVAHRSRTRLSIVVSCEVEGGRKLRVVRGSHRHTGQWLLSAAEAAARELSDLINSVEAVSLDGPTMLPVFFEAGWCAGVWIHEVVGHALEADSIERGWSAFGDLLGSKVAPASLTVTDSPLLPDMTGSMQWDDEAVSTRETVLVEAGRIAGVLNDRRSAALAGTECTGNGRRQDYRYRAQPRMSNLIVGSGKADPYELAVGLPRCIVVKSMTGGRLDGRSGGFAFPVGCAEMLAYGECISVLRDLTVSGSSVSALSGLIAVGGDTKPDEGRGRCSKNGQIVDVGMLCPSILIEELTVAPSAA